MARRQSAFVVAALLFILVGLPALVFGYEYMVRPHESSRRTITIDMSAPEAGGFAPDAIAVDVGESVTLRFRSKDVTHGIAIGPGVGIDLGQIDPGRTAEVTLSFDKPGTYTYYCNTWCSADHWRMRGVIEVRDPAHPGAVPTAQADPVIEALLAEGIDIDAERHAGQESDEHHGIAAPSAARGEQAIGSLVVPSDLTNPAWRQTHTPDEAVALLSQANPEAAEPDLRDATAYLWVSPPSFSAESLYNKNCAACHGQTGGGDGPAASATAEEPVAFTDSTHMLSMRSDVLYAKIRRGGMGTDMPNFGTVFTPDETWDVVAYLWWLAFQ